MYCRRSNASPRTTTTFEGAPAQKFFTHTSVSTFDRVPFQLTDELFSLQLAAERDQSKTRPPSSLFLAPQRRPRSQALARARAFRVNTR
eukprot:17417-Pelagococcus_subviridis.AAC.1